VAKKHTICLQEEVRSMERISLNLCILSISSCNLLIYIFTLIP